MDGAVSPEGRCRPVPDTEPRGQVNPTHSRAVGARPGDRRHADGTVDSGGQAGGRMWIARLAMVVTVVRV